MDSSWFARIEWLFHAALERPPAQRTQFLRDNESDARLREEVETLLQRHDNDDAVLQNALWRTAVATPQVGQRMGPYRILRELGSGGMGTVLLAERLLGDTPQRVALKLIRGMPTAAARERLARERALLAELNHPNIARLFDAGETDSHEPYLAMEYVDGEPLLAYCARHDLDLAARLHLFAQVCRAVHHAHQHLIVHRDIKPANILMREDGTPVLLDFGIGKLLDPTLDDRTATQAFTPAYAAPEQRRGGRVTTATDIYGLGCVLYELLSGGTMKAPRDGERLPPPSATADDPGRARALRGDLDRIAGKALFDDPEQRYVSAEALAEDIERHLDGRPIRAHPPTRRYRFGKFVQRHRRGVAAGTILVLAMIATLALALRQTHLADREAQRAGAVRDFLVSVFRAAGADLPKDKRPSTQDIVDQASAQLMARSDLPDALRVDMLLTLAKVARSVGAYDEALRLLDRAKPIIDRLYGNGAEQWYAERVQRANLIDDKSQDPKAVIALLGPLRDRLLTRRDAVGLEGLTTLASSLISSGKEEEGIELLHRTHAMLEAKRQPDMLLDLSIREANALLNAHRFAQGFERADAALSLWRSQGEPASQSIVDLYGAIAIGAEASGDIARAETAYKEAIAYGDRFFDKPNASTAWQVGIYGSFLVAQGRYAEAEPWLRRGLDMRRTVFGDDDPRTLYAVAAMGRLYGGEHRYADAAAWYTQGVETCRRAGVLDNACPRMLGFRARTYASLKRYAEAEKDLREALDLQRRISGESSPNYAFVLYYLVVVQVQEGKYEAAIASADRVLAIDKSVKGGMLQTDLQVRYWRAKALSGMERDAEALSEVIEAERQYAASFAGAPGHFDMLALKARLLARAHRLDEAADAAQAALALRTEADSASEDTLTELKALAAR
ncbi:MAG: serine/threonine-protein kinase [Rudaea sp.]|uniref:protein kinase domain-containing protein n=1 Tax=Rudaea sp. TaxID=2136325 RepID=UPI0039E67269